MRNLKKLTALLLAGTMMFTCVACGGNGGNNNTENQGGANNGTVAVEVADATELLTKVWDEYKNSAAEDVQFPIGGGDAENMTMDAPGKFNKDSEGGADMLTATFCVPAEVIAEADDFATGMHMMMSNNFATAALHVTDAAKVETVVSSVKDATLNNQWMCGMPEKFIVVTVGEDYVVTAYGLSVIIDAYEAAITTVYGDAAVVVVEENIAQ